MNTKILTILFLALALTGCKKESDLLVDGQTPEMRSQESLKLYGDQLIAAKYGWEAFLFTEGGGGYGFIWISTIRTGLKCLLRSMQAQQRTLWKAPIG